MPHALPELAAELRIACMRLSRRVRHQTSALPPHHFSVLAHLERRGTRTAADLAAWERVSAPSMSRTVGELAERGLIERTPDDTDKRRVNLTLTPAGKALLTAGRRERDQWMVQHLERCSEADLETLARAVVILDAMLEEG